MSKRSVVGSTIILMFAGFFVRLIGFVYRIYLSNLIGAEGMGLFQLIFPVYSLVILTLSSGVSIAVSKLVAQELAKNNIINLKRITSCATTLVIIISLFVSVFMYIYIDYIADVVLKDHRTYYSLVLLIPCIPVISGASALKGYFYGIREVAPTALSQIVEQIVRISLVTLTAGYFLKLGLEYACALATIGMTVGEIANFLVLYIYYKLKKHKKKSKKGLKRKRTILKQILTISIPVSLNRFITSFMSTVQVILIPRRLLAGGLDYQNSMELYGKLTGMAIPLLFFPSIVTSSLATVLVPTISEAVASKQYRSINYKISRSIQMTSLLGFIFTAVFVCYPNQIGDILYRSKDVGSIIKLLSYSCIFIYLQQTLSGMLNGLGKEKVSLRNSVTGHIIRIGFVYYCIPVYGIKGFMWGIIVSSLLVCILDMRAVTRTSGMSLDLRNWIIKPAVVCIAMIFGSKYINILLNIYSLTRLWQTLLSITAQLGIAVLMIILLDILSIEELMKFTGLKKILHGKVNFKNFL